MYEYITLLVGFALQTTVSAKKVLPQASRWTSQAVVDEFDDAPTQGMPTLPSFFSTNKVIHFWSPESKKYNFGQLLVSVDAAPGAYEYDVTGGDVSDDEREVVTWGVDDDVSGDDVASTLSDSDDDSDDVSSLPPDETKST